jgi:prephenate dehydratase
MVTTKLGVSGDVGSFSEEAALAYAKREGISPSLVYLIDMEGVLAGIENKDITLGIFPVVNLQGGLVKSAFQAMGRHRFKPIDELWLHVHQCLLIMPGTKSPQINKIVSHPQGLAQCKHYLQEKFKMVDRIEWCDTAKAAKDLAEGNLAATTAVIGPERCAELYGLEVLARNIEDNERNLTAFVLVKNGEEL